MFSTQVTLPILGTPWQSWLNICFIAQHGTTPYAFPTWVIELKLTFFASMHNYFPSNNWKRFITVRRGQNPTAPNHGSWESTAITVSMKRCHVAGKYAKQIKTWISPSEVHLTQLYKVSSSTEVVLSSRFVKDYSRKHENQTPTFWSLV